MLNDDNIASMMSEMNAAEALGIYVILLLHLRTKDAYEASCKPVLLKAMARRYAGKSRYLYAGTSNPAVYQAMGFEYAYTVPNFFLDHYPEPIIDQGEQCVDMIYLRRDLNGMKEER